MNKQIQFLLAFFIGFAVHAQQDTLVQLREVEVSDNLLHNYSQTQKTQKITDTILKQSGSYLTSLLKYNSLIYFKENGLGGSSSPSFRGTTASQTAVIWNGININSQLLGQTDFNAVNVLNFDNIVIKSGGGSVLYGSSAIGGSVHLNNDLVFKNVFENKLFLRYGSFNTWDGNYKTTIASEKYSLQIGINRSSSDNNYKWVDKSRNNLNGQYENVSFDFNAGYKLNKGNVLKFYSQIYDGSRNFSLILPSEIPTKYDNFNIRNLLEWSSSFSKFVSKVKLAHLYEEYKYFANINSDTYTFGEVESFIARYDLAYTISNKLKLNTIVDFTQNKGEGSNIQNEKRQIGSASLMLKHKLSEKFLYELSARKEITNNYKSPFLFSLGTNLKLSKFYSLNVNLSKNFRIPTFNDLYWQGSGNTDLKPEISNQVELINKISFNKISFSITGFYNDIKDMLRWVPSGSVWRPENTDRVEIYGLEFSGNYQKQFNNHKISISGNYGYTSSKDKNSNKYLIYVPHHKANGRISYQYKKIGIYSEFLYVGEVYTRSDNNSKYNLDGYQLINLGVDYSFSESFLLGVKAQNLSDVYYESVEDRPLPGRNYLMYINFKF